MALAIEMARRMVKLTLAEHPETILETVRSALLQLPQGHAQIQLHPDDLALVRELLGEQLAQAGHRLQENARLARGECRIDGQGAQVDATLETRWRRVLESIGHERARWEVWRAGRCEPRRRRGQPRWTRTRAAAALRSARLMNRHQALWRDFLGDGRRLVEGCNPLEVSGRLTRINGLVMEASGSSCPSARAAASSSPAAAFGRSRGGRLHGEKIFLMPTDDVFGLAPGAQVLPVEPTRAAPGAGERIEPAPARIRPRQAPAHGRRPARPGGRRRRPPARRPRPAAVRHSTRRCRRARSTRSQRAPIAQPLDVGIRAINACSPSAAASAWACSPAPAWANRC
jgi:hypothetical protein